MAAMRAVAKALLRLWALGAAWMVQAAGSRRFEPGDEAPAFSVATLNGTITVGPGSEHLPLVVVCLDAHDPFSSRMWRSPDSLAALLQRSPGGASFLFLSYGDGAEAAAWWMRQQLLDHARALRLPSGQVAELLQRLHWAMRPVQRLDSWLVPLLAQWQTPRRILRATAWPAGRLGGSREVELLSAGRLDAFYGWLPWPVSGVRGPVAFAGSDCGWLAPGGGPHAALNGTVALIALTALPGSPALAEGQGVAGGAACSYARMAAAAQRAGASAVAFSAPPGVELEEANCTGPAECGQPVAIPVTMVPYLVGEVVREELAGGGAVAAAFLDVPGPGLFAGVDASARLFDVGWLKLPSLLHAVWAAQWQDYLGRLQARLAEPALTVPVLAGGVSMEGQGRLRAGVMLPSWHELAGRDRVELDLALGCTSANDSSCPAWDHVVQLFVCCQDPARQLPPCDACQPTVWLPGSHGGAAGEEPPERSRDAHQKGGALLRRGGGGGGGARSLAGSGGGREARAAEPLSCGRELGRWITPFRRGVGRWLTDVSPLQALLLPGQQCTFTLQSAAWAGPWVPSLSLRYSHGGDGGRGMRSVQDQPPLRRVLRLPFDGGAFDAAYNSRHPPFAFATPARLRRALLVSRITGHGSDENACAEFCPTSHELSVNGQAHSVEYGDAGTLWGCADNVLDGVVPNEHGTWLYGRNGWCDGQDVKPWVVDVTASLRPEGRSNTVAYRGLYRGGAPHPQQLPGFIMMQSSLVLLLEGPG